MKKGLLLLVVLFLSVSLFADDAMVLPSGVLRATFANSLINADSVYDRDGKVDSDDQAELMIDNLGAALEFGITDIITAAVQWAPGMNAYSDFEYDAQFGSKDEDIVFTGAADLFIGSKVQLLNNDSMRFALALGAKIPLDSYDAEKEAKAYIDDKEFRISTQSDTDGLGLGGRVYFDYKINKDFYINLYNQTIYYLAVEKYDVTDTLTYAGTYAAYIGGGEDLATEKAKEAIEKEKYEYGIAMDFEIEPHYNIDLAKTASLGIGVPFKYSWMPDTKVEGDVVSDSGSYAYSIAPAASFFYKGGFPFELTAQYDFPLGGLSTQKTGIFIVKLKLFYDFY